MMVTNEAENCFIAVNPGMCRVREQINQLARVNIPVLILGESGTGKEVVAKQIHNQSPRAHRTFLKVNCAALPAELLESELFGYEAGAFTGAQRARAGKFELADKGTIFLDEFAEMPTHLQAKLLHVLQDGEFMRLGGQQRMRTDVRVLAATNVNVHEAMENKTLREDLYYRLGGFVINLPPLRQRPEDIPALLQHCVTRFAAAYNLPPARLTPEFIEACVKFDWPGNVRQLENIAKRLVVLGNDESGFDCMAGPTHAGGPIRAAAPPVYEDDLKQKVRT
jgi:transcriptional regulator with PAS, ATPase and Fis domain